MSRFDAAEYERARTFLIEIAKDLLPEGTQWRTEGNEQRAEHAGGLSINTKKAAWHLWGAGIGGYSPLKLIEQLRPGYPAEERVQWLVAWLGKHPGTGSCSLDADDDDEDGSVRSPASVARAREVLDAMQPAEGTPAEVYLRSRGIEPPYPDCVGYIEGARCGEGAVVAVLTVHDRTVGVQAGYLTPDGKKSLITPQREQFRLEKARGAVFRLPPTPEALAGPRDPVADFLTVEGIEDALSLRLALLDRPCVVYGLPGIGALANLDLPPKSRVVHFEDGDEKGSAADLGCIRGIDHLLDAGMYVWTVPTPLGLDANAILTEPNLGIDALRAMLRRARSREDSWPPGLFTPSLSFEARVGRLAKLDGIAFAQERAAIAKIFKVSVAVIDAELKPLRPKPPRTGGADDPSTGGEPEPLPDEPWEEPLPPLGTILEGAVAAMRRFLVAEDFHYDTTALWTGVTHLVQREEVALPVMPQLAVQSSSPDAGKSVHLEITSTLSYRGQLRSSYTAATLFRRIAEYGVTFCLSELHNILTEKNTDMRAIVDACHRRAEAFVDRVENRKDGSRYTKTYRCWAAIAWGSIGPMVREVQSRAIVLPMKPALPAEYHGLDHSSPSLYPALITARRQLAAWAATINQPLDHVLPVKLFNRLGDNWRPLIAVAALAGGDWPKRALAAMEAVEAVEKPLPLNVRLLTSIRAALLDAPDHRLGTEDLIDKLCEDGEAGWDEANNRKRITEYWLRENLRGLLDPKGSREWQEWQKGKTPKRTHVRGYELYQFKDAILRYLPPDTHSATPRPASGTSGTFGTEQAKAAETAEFSGPGSVIDPGASGIEPGQEKASEYGDLRVADPDVPDVPDHRGLGGEEEAAADLVAVASVSLLITQAQKVALRAMGYSDEQIREMPPAVAHRLLGLGGAGHPTDTAAAIILRRLEKPGSFVLVTMIEGSPHYAFDDGTLVPGQSGKALTEAEFSRLDLVPVEGESLFENGMAQRYVLRRPAEATSPTLAEKLAEKLGSAPQAPNGPTIGPTVEGETRRPRQRDMIRDAVLAHAREHPEWGAKDISKVVPRAPSVIQRILDAALRDCTQEGTA